MRTYVDVNYSMFAVKRHAFSCCYYLSILFYLRLVADGKTLCILELRGNLSARPVQWAVGRGVRVLCRVGGGGGVGRGGRAGGGRAGGG